MTNTWVRDEIRTTLRYNGRDAHEVVSKTCISGDVVVQWSSLWGRRGNDEDERDWRYYGNKKIRQQNRYQFQHPPAHYFNPCMYSGIKFLPQYNSIRRGIRSDTNDTTRPYSREEMFENDDEEDQNSDDPDANDPEEDRRILLSRQEDFNMQQEWEGEINEMIVRIRQGNPPAHLPVQKNFRIFHEKLVSRSNQLKAQRKHDNTLKGSAIPQGSRADFTRNTRSIEVPLKTRDRTVLKEPFTKTHWMKLRVDVPITAQPAISQKAENSVDIIPLKIHVEPEPVVILVDDPVVVLVDDPAVNIVDDVVVVLVEEEPVVVLVEVEPVAVPADEAEAVPADEPEAVPADALPLLIGVESEMLKCIICQEMAEKIDGFMCKCNVGAQMICEECFFANMTSLTVSDHTIHRLHCCKECDDWTIQEVLVKCAKERIPNVLMYTDSLRDAEKNKLVEMLNASTAFVDDTTKPLADRVAKARRKVSDLMCDSCPVCNTIHDGHDACISISCNTCKDKDGEALNFCGWCKDFVGTSAYVHAHAHFCAHRMPRIQGQYEYLFPAAGLSALSSNLYKMRLVDKFLVNVSHEVSRLVLFNTNLIMHWCTVPDVFYTIHRCAIKSKMHSRMIFTSIALRLLYQTEQLLLASAG